MANVATLAGRHSRVSDYLMNFRFHLMDVSFDIPPVLSAGFGFRYCSTPEITTEMKEVKDGAYEYKRSVPLSASVSDVELQQGVQFFNSDFYDWIVATIRGKQQMRRNLLLIHFSTVSLLGDTTSGSPLTSSLNAFVPFNDLFGYYPARAWLMKDCLPVRYKPGSDFDALGGEVSIAELTVRPYQVDEFSLGF